MYSLADFTGRFKRIVLNTLKNVKKCKLGLLSRMPAPETEHTSIEKNTLQTEKKPPKNNIYIYITKWRYI